MNRERNLKESHEKRKKERKKKERKDTPVLKTFTHSK